MKVKTRQRARRIILIIMMLIFPIVMNYISPYVIIAASFVGFINGSLIAFSMMFLSSLFLGRLYCGWICPASGLQETCLITSPKPFKSKKGNMLKYFIWVVWAGFITFGFISAGGIKGLNPLFFTESGISVDRPMAYLIYIPVIFLVLTMGVIRKRAFCHTTCWMAPFMVFGRKISNFLKIPSLRLNRNDKNECTHCKICTKNCPMDIDVEKMVQENDLEHSECILCGNCIDTCPKNVIEYSFKSYKKNK